MAKGAGTGAVIKCPTGIYHRKHFAMDTSYDGEQVNVVLYMHADNSLTD